jgi:23S rRNA pseudouridine1911/1915/1917 synthase
MEEYQIQESDVIYLDNHLLVLKKPVGLLAQTDKEGNFSVEDAAKAWLKEKFSKPGNVFAFVAHRLDRPVGGLVILARTSKALSRMQALFANRSIKKVYLAITAGKPEPTKHLRHWIKKKEDKNKVFTYTYERGDAKQADLRYFHLASSGELSLMMVRLFTGRHHQIRGQLGLEKLPLIGDLKYGDKSALGNCPFLYAYAVEFEHPVTKETIRLHAPYPEYGLWKEFSPPDEDMLQRALDAENNP